jgi:hypothetical protein
MSCGGGSGNGYDDDPTIRYAVGITDVLDGTFASSSPRVEVMGDNTYNVTVLYLAQAPDGCVDYTCICLEGRSLCRLVDPNRVTVKYGTLSDDEANALEDLIRSPIVVSTKGKNCRYYDATIYDNSVTPWREKACTDGDLDALDLEIQRIMKTLITRAQ